MSVMQPVKIAVCCMISLLCMANASALDIVITNDDGMESALSYALYMQLKSAGHRVLISAPVADQSGRGGAIDALRPIGALQSASRGGCVMATAPPAPGLGNLGSLGEPGARAPWLDASCPADANVFWVNSTPTTSALYGIDVAAQARFGRSPDLVISGPNYGNNTGYITNASGTVNAALVALNRGIPAIAVSAAEPTSYRSLRDGLTDSDRELADIVVRLVAVLERNRQHDRKGNAVPMLPNGFGLNVNVPKFSPGTAALLRFRLTDIGSYSIATMMFSEDLCAEPLIRGMLGKACAGAPLPKLSGVGFVPNNIPMPAGLSSLADTNPLAEQKIVDAGEIAVSVMQGTHQAEGDSARRVTRQLHGLIK
jgi:5'-nucleotidase